MQKEKVSRRRRIVVLIGSDNDLPQMIPGLEYLRAAGDKVDVAGVHTMSIHRNTGKVLSFLSNLKDGVPGVPNQADFPRGPVDVIIAGAGCAAHLPGVIDSYLRYTLFDASVPVIGVAFENASNEKYNEAARLSISEVPGTQVVYQDEHGFFCGEDGFLRACQFAVMGELPSITQPAPRLVFFRSLEEARIKAGILKAKYQPFLDCLPLIHQGKVRDSFGGTTTPGTFLVVATDRISTNDIVHKSVIPGKGEILTAMTVFWVQEVLKDIPHQIVAFGKDIYKHLPKGKKYPEDLHLRGLIVKRLTMIPYEFIFRGRMAGSLWDKYYSKGLPNPYEVNLPEDLALMSPLDPIIFTPTEKSETDDPVSASEIESRYPDAVALMRDVYLRGRNEALSCGIEIIDFKGEVGIDTDGNLILADEYLTGDCCRFVQVEDITLGKNPPWADKQIFRDDAARQWAGDKTKPPLEFPEEVITTGMRRYNEVFEALTWCYLREFQDTYLQ